MIVASTGNALAGLGLSASFLPRALEAIAHHVNNDAEQALIELGESRCATQAGMPIDYVDTGSIPVGRRLGFRFWKPRAERGGRESSIAATRCTTTGPTVVRRTSATSWPVSRS